MTLTVFLLARIAEEEAAIPSLGDKQRIEVRVSQNFPGRGWVVVPRSAASRELRRLRAGCEAKRRIAAELESLVSDGGMSSEVASRSLRHMAAVYSDHPDYDPEWRP